MSATSQRLGWGQKIGYGSGDFAFNLYWQGISLYLFYFYTDVLGLPNAMAGIIYAIGSFWDAGTDPIMGYLADRRSHAGGAIALIFSLSLSPWHLVICCCSGIPMICP